MDANQWRARKLMRLHTSQILTSPRFLGSYHMKEEKNPKYKTFNTLMKGDLEVKYAKALRSTLINPITIALIVIALIFNVLWFFFI